MKRQASSDLNHLKKVWYGRCATFVGCPGSVIGQFFEF